MTDFNGRNVETLHHGVITTWREITYPVPVFAAEGHGPDGVHKGFGDTEQKAMVSLLEELEIARLDAQADEPAPTAYGVAEALGFVQGRYMLPSRPPEWTDLPATFWVELRTGQKIRAIKTLRDATKLSLRSSKEIVDAILEGRNAHA